MPKDEFTNETVVRKAEGGTISTAELHGKPVVFVNEAALLDMLTEEEQRGMSPTSLTVFDSDEERAKYLKQRYGIILETNL